jgi:hypothetical protein
MVPPSAELIVGAVLRLSRMRVTNALPGRKSIEIEAGTSAYAHNELETKSKGIKSKATRREARR